jgi:hypothetical protein
VQQSTLPTKSQLEPNFVALSKLAFKISTTLALPVTLWHMMRFVSLDCFIVFAQSISRAALLGGGEIWFHPQLATL